MPTLERRSAPRVNIHAGATLALNGDSWNGTVLDISLDGLYMVFPSTVSVTGLQPIQLGLVSDVGVLEIHGTVVAIREATGQQAEQSDCPPLGLAVKFAPLETTGRQILESLVDALSERAIAIRLTGLLIAQETGDLLLEVSAGGAGRNDLTPIHGSPPETEDTTAAPPERRLTSRGALVIPVHIRPRQPSSTFPEFIAEAMDIGLGGMSLRTKTRPQTSAEPVVLRFSVPQGSADPPLQARSSHAHASTHDAGRDASEFTVTAEIVWTATAPAPDGDRGPDDPSGTLRLGLRFPNLDDDTRLRIAGLVAGLLTSPEDLGQAAAERTVVSESLDCRNPKGQRLALYHDRRRDTLPSNTPVVIIAPGYGETKKEHIPLAYYLAVNGFHVLRYDHSNHVGESDGDIQHSTLTGMHQDLAAVIDFAEHRWPAGPLAVITTSLAGRVALKTISHDHRVKLLVLLTGVVDVQATLLAVHQEDLVGDHMRGVKRGVINMLGFNIDADNWLKDAVETGYADLRGTVKDVSQATTPVVFFCAEHDAWVSLESVKTVHATLRSDRGHLYVIPEALHRLNENPRKARAVFRQLVACCLEHFAEASAVREVQQPSQREIGLQGRLERERARARNQMARIENVQFWRDYLEHFHYIANVSDFWQLLDHVYRLLGPLTANGRILDAGCGNGNFGVFLMVNRAYSHRHTATNAPPAFSYVGTDFVFDALIHARRNLAHVAAESVPATARPSASVSSLALSDLNSPLPFSDNRFTCVVSNLVIGYLHDPLFTLREMMRVLAPTGKLVISNLKPQSDLSQVYRNFVQSTERSEEVDEARQLLNNSGKIKLGESDGIFRFFNRQELTTLLLCSGAQQPRIYSTFANQAFIAVATKPDAARIAPASSEIRLEPVYHA